MGRSSKWQKRVTVTIVTEFQNILDSPKRKPSKIWVDQGSEFITILLKND